MSAATNRQRRRLSQMTRRVAAPVAVLAGGFLGAGTRTAIAEMFPIGSGRFPATTLAINLAGSLLLGFYLARRQRAIGVRWSLHFWAIGGLGSFTTFSTFSAEVFRLISTGAVAVAVWYVVISMVGGVAAAVLGDRLGTVGR